VANEGDRWARTVLYNASDMITILETDATIRYVSAAVERILGFRPVELVGTLAFDYVHPEDMEFVSSSFAQALENPGVMPPIEFRLRTADGSWRDVEATRNNLLEDSSVRGVVVNARDITERKEAEERLRESEERFRLLAEIGRDFVFRYRFKPTPAHDYVTPWSTAITGYTPEEFYADPHLGHKMVHPDDRHFIDEVLRSPESPITIRWRRKNGELLWSEQRNKPIYDEAGELVAIEGIGRDVTEYKRIEEQLEHRALHDLLTDLPNRHLFVDRLKQALRRTRREKGRQAAVLFMDIDDFKAINDSLGHEIGDVLLVGLAERLRRCLRPEDTLARFGGDEFVVLIEDVESPEDAVRVTERSGDDPL
jgi:PAS domain S-box-containing protein